MWVVIVIVWFISASSVESKYVKLVHPPSVAVTSRIPFRLTKFRASSSDGVSKLKGSQGLLYYGALEGIVKVGTPPQAFAFILDTGSQETWVRSSNCKSGAGCPSGAASFDTTASSTWESQDRIMEYGPYGDGLDSYGRTGYDTLSIAGIGVKHQNMGAVDNITIGYGSMGADGIMGIPAANLQNKTFDSRFVPGNMYNQGVLDSPIWAFWYNNSNPVLGVSYLDGQLSLGGLDPKLYYGDIKYVPLLWDPAALNAKNLAVLSAYWFVSLTSITVGSGSNVITTKNAPASGGQSTVSGFVLNKPGEIPLLVDTGTTLTILPTRVVKAMVSALKGSPVPPETAGASGLYGPNCEALDFSKYQNISIVIGGQTLTAAPREYTIPDSEGNFCNGVFLFQADDSPPLGGGILGALSQSAFYNIFDWGNRKIGFATPSQDGAGSGLSNGANAAGVGGQPSLQLAGKSNPTRAAKTRHQPEFHAVPKGTSYVATAISPPSDDGVKPLIATLSPDEGGIKYTDQALLMSLDRSVRSKADRIASTTALCQLVKSIF
ncbi:hypothetical protein SeLEV6574_g06390 [Synchytrium endobioticum]|nr:hypothetical protein SeLEV6574_g06390 [Synchytrium endobioticum]